MNPVRSVKNQYRGINAHLHSYWQGENRWHEFHNYHIGQLMTLLKAQLLPMGYTAVMETSLQIRRLGDETRQVRADIVIRDLLPERYAQVTSPAPATTLTLEELLEDEDVERPYFAIAIYERVPNLPPGNVIAWVELLSLTNKGYSADANTYLSKRRLLLERGIVFVEIDYLHETPSTFYRLGDYTRMEKQAHAYRIAVLNPGNNWRTGTPDVYQFDVDDKIPSMIIPLSAGHQLKFDFDAAYQTSFEQALFGLELVNYHEFPLNFERYSEADRARIANRMLAVLRAAKAGADLEASAPLGVEGMELGAALEQIGTLVT